ncbi:hypothetical protein ACFXTO_029014 [Malus domestica]
MLGKQPRKGSRQLVPDQKFDFRYFQGGRKLSLLRGLVAYVFLARKKSQAFWMCALPWRMKVDLHRDFSIAGNGVDVALSPTFVGKSVVVGILNFMHFQLYQRSLTKLHVLSNKLRLRLKSVDGLYTGKSGF